MDKNEERIWDSIVVSAKQLLDEARKILDSIPAGAGTGEKYVASVRADPAVFADSIIRTVNYWLIENHFFLLPSIIHGKCKQQT